MISPKHLNRAADVGGEYPLPGHRVQLGVEEPLRLDCGVELRNFPVSYQT